MSLAREILPLKFPLQFLRLEKKRSNLHNILPLTPDINCKNVFFSWSQSMIIKFPKFVFIFFVNFLTWKEMQFRVFILMFPTYWNLFLILLKIFSSFLLKHIIWILFAFVLRKKCLNFLSTMNKLGNSTLAILN